MAGDTLQELAAMAFSLEIAVERIAVELERLSPGSGERVFGPLAIPPGDIQRLGDPAADVTEHLERLRAGMRRRLQSGG